MAIYIKFDDIEGEVTASDYEGWTEVDSVEREISRVIYTNPGNSRGREKGPLTISQITMSKRDDASCIPLISYLQKGQIFEKAEIHYCTTGGNEPPRKYRTHELENILISHYSESGNSDGITAELSLSFQKITTTQFPYESNGRPGAPLPVGYDLITAESL